MSRCLVTGGVGFIGSNIVDELVKRGHRVRVVDNLSTGFLSNIKPHGSRVEFQKGDICKLSDLKRACKGMDFVFHTAANRAVLRSVDDPGETNEVNVTGTLNVLIAARDAKVKRVIYSASSSAYGENSRPILRENDLPRPESPYAAQKLMGEYYCRIFYRLYGLETVSLRYFNVFGPRQNPESKYSAVIPIFIEQLLKNKSPEIHWDGKQSRDFSYVDNVVEGNLCAMTAKNKDGKVFGEVFNIACHEEFSVIDIFHELQRLLNKKHIKPVFAPKRSGDVRRTFADITAAKRYLNFKVQTRFIKGLEKTVAWFLDNNVLGR